MRHFYAIVRVRTAGFTPGELEWPTTWTDRAGEVDIVFDVIGGDIGKRSARLVRAGGTLVTIAGPPEARPADGLAIDFVVVSDRAQLGEVVQRVRDGRLRTVIGNVATSMMPLRRSIRPSESREGRSSASARKDAETT